MPRETPPTQTTKLMNNMKPNQNKADDLAIEASRLVRPDIVVDCRVYEWDATEMSYFGNEGSSGTYGSALDEKGSWRPLWIPTDSCNVQWAEDSFDNPKAAISESHSYFS
jgi:hypothetical protein